MTLGFDGTDMSLMGLLSVCAIELLIVGVISVWFVYSSKKELTNNGGN